jgi:CelD/BcsL family acetyltransferase involved in cellulose biosynthesis
MYPQATATFTHPDWLRAVSGQVPGGRMVSLPETGFPRLVTCLRQVPLPIRHFDSWITPLTSAGLPTVAPGADTAVAQLLEQLESPILFRNIPVDHPVGRAILDLATHVHVLRSWERAGLSLSGTYETWLEGNFDHHRRKELKRQRARLEEQGNLEVRRLAPGGELSAFIANFLALESAGWKGRRQTALASNPRLAAGLQDGLAAMHAHGRVRFWEMLLDGRPVASLYALIDGGEACLGKIAHDEGLSKYSPGVQIILEATRDLFAEEGLDIADSNAIPGHPMIERIWRDRIACVDVLVAGPTVTSPAFRLLANFMAGRQTLRAVAKKLFIRITGRKIS